MSLICGIRDSLFVVLYLRYSDGCSALLANNKLLLSLKNLHLSLGFMLEHEKEKLLGYQLNYDKYWVPINWSYNLFFEARRAGKITSDVMTNKMCDVRKMAK